MTALYYRLMRTEFYEQKGVKTCIPVAESYKDCMTLIKSDRYRVTGRQESTLSIILYMLRPFSDTLLFWLRLASYKGFLHRFCRYMYKRAGRKAQVQISPYTKIGYGLYTGHSICMVINKGTVIGNNVNISQFLNIGTNKETPAIIGDNVYIGPHVCIVEDVCIGNSSTIGAGAVVTRDVPENATVAGVPAKVLHYNNPGQYVINRH